MSDKNLIPFTKETAKRKGKKGGIASGVARRKKRGLKEVLNIILNGNHLSAEMQRKLLEYGYKSEEINNELYLAIKVFEVAAKGNVKAIEFIRDTTGQKPKDEIAIVEAPKIFDDIPDIKIDRNNNDIKTE